LIEYSVRCDCCSKTIIGMVYELSTEYATNLQYCDTCYFNLKQDNLLSDDDLKAIRHVSDILESYIKKV